MDTCRRVLQPCLRAKGCILRVPEVRVLVYHAWAALQAVLNGVESRRMVPTQLAQCREVSACKFGLFEMGYLLCFCGIVLRAAPRVDCR